MTIGVAFSRTPAGHAALLLAAREAVEHHTDLVVLNITDTSEHAKDPAVTEKVQVDVAAVLANSPHRSQLDWRVINEPTQGSLADALIGLAEGIGADMLVIGSRRRSAVGKLVMGSTVRQVLLDAPMPVLVTKPD